MTTVERVRIHGLDTLRALAILLVVAYHTMVFVTHEATFGWVSVVGWIGVDLFFVLSGYLIADQLLASIRRGRLTSLRTFYGRRLLRTLPNFYVIVGLYRLFPTAMGGTAPPPWWRFLTLTQNVGLLPGTAFSHAWSLCIEEQFYAILPAVLLVAVAIARSGRGRIWMAWALIAGLICAGIAARSVLWHFHGRTGATDYYRWVYYATPARLDEFLPGVALALLRHAHPAVWTKVTAHGQRLLLAGVLAVGLMCWLVLTAFEIEGVGYAYVMTAFGYTLIAASFAVLVAAALSPRSWLHRCRIPGAAPLAAWSYAIYLTHKPIAFAAQRVLPAWPTFVLLPLLALACLCGGWLLWRLVEQPFMALRDRWLPSSSGPLTAHPSALPEDAVHALA